MFRPAAGILGKDMLLRSRSCLGQVVQAIEQLMMPLYRNGHLLIVLDQVAVAGESHANGASP